jgi:N-carbamoyl-L-amino-acid hydrolase
MAKRTDASLAMARIIELAHSMAIDNQPDTLCGVGQIKVTPNSRNVLPEAVIFTVDIRSPNPQLFEKLRKKLESSAEHICKSLGVGCQVEPVGHFEPVSFDPNLASQAKEVAEALGYRNMTLTSGAGHDACRMTRVAPTVMVMCPCHGGLSHSEAESITVEWATAGANVLFHTAMKTAELVGSEAS